jgi:hypothetical protein
VAALIVAIVVNVFSLFNLNEYLLGSESQTNDVSPTSKSAVAITRTEEQVLRQEEDEEVMTSQGRIRSWGCGNTNTTFIFVPIGKAGGGNVRHRIASSRLNITSNTKNQRYQDLILNSSEAYFSVATTTTRWIMKIKMAARVV